MREAIYHAVLGLFMAALLVETALYLLAPRLYALFALAPFGQPRRVPVSAGAREGLAIAPAPAPPAALAGYREPARLRPAPPPLDMTRLDVPPRLETSAVITHAHLDRGFMTARLPYQFTNRTLALVRVDLRETDGAIELRPRFVALGWPSIALAGPLGLIGLLSQLGAQAALPYLGIGAVFVVMSACFGWLFVRGRLAEGVLQIESQVTQALAEAATRRHELRPGGW